MHNARILNPEADLIFALFASFAVNAFLFLFP